MFLHRLPDYIRPGCILVMLCDRAIAYWRGLLLHTATTWEWACWCLLRLLRRLLPLRCNLLLQRLCPVQLITVCPSNHLGIGTLEGQSWLSLQHFGQNVKVGMCIFVITEECIEVNLCPLLCFLRHTCLLTLLSDRHHLIINHVLNSSHVDTLTDTLF